MRKRSKYVCVSSIEAFIPLWEHKIDRIISSFNMQDYADDIKQDIYLEMCKKDENGLNGLERFDSEKGSFSTYVYALILTKVRNARSKRIRELALMPYSQDQMTEREDRSPRGKDRLELRGKRLSGGISEKRRVEFKIQLENIMKELKRLPVRSYFFRNGVCVTRDLATLLEMILKECTRDEIVRYFGYSTGSVGVMFDRLRNVKEVIELKKMVNGGD